MLQIKKETANIWEYKVGNNANIANFVYLWKTQVFSSTVNWIQYLSVYNLSVVFFSIWQCVQV